MKSLVLAAMLILNADCQKDVFTPVNSPVNSTVMLANTMVMVADTTVNTIWDGGGRVLRINDYIIHGTGTLQNCIIDAALTQQIFDTSLNLKNIQTYNDVFSTAWYGTKTTNADNWWNVQKSINTCMSNGLTNCFTPNGTYKHSKPLEIKVIANNAYQQCSLHFYGDASYWDNGQGTAFQYTSASGCGFNMQLNKGSEIDHLQFFGLFKSPVTADSIYYNTTEADFRDVSGNNCDDSYIGVAIDWRPPIDSTTRSGSTGIHLHEVSIGGYSKLLAMSQNGITQNDDILRVENLHLYDGKWGIVNGQAQEKDMRFNGVFSWGSLYCVVSIGKHGNWQAGDYSFDGANISGRNIHCFDISAAHWFSTHIDHWFAESIGTVGTFSTQIPITVDHSTFDCVSPSVIGRQILISSNSTQVQFNDDIIRYYDGLGTDVWFHGHATFNNCYFGGGKIIWK